MYDISFHLLTKDEQYSLVPVSQMWGFAAFIFF